MQETELVQEHQSRVLLIKLAWITISGLCLVCVSALWRDERLAVAYWSARVGSSLWMLASLGLIVAASLWLQSKGMTLIARSMDIGAWIVVLVWCGFAVSSAIASHQSRYRSFIDIALPVSGLATLFITTKMRASGSKSPGENIVRVHPKSPPPRSSRTTQNNDHLLEATRRTARIVLRVDTVEWALVAICFFISTIVWLTDRQAPSSFPALTSSFAGLVALMFSLLCWAVITKLQGAQKISAKRSMLRRGGELKYVAEKVDLIGWVLTVLSMITLFLGVKYLGKNQSISATVVAALFGGIAAITGGRIKLFPKFSDDRVRVFSSSMGSQFICPVELILDDKIYAEMASLVADLHRSPGPDNEKP